MGLFPDVSPGRRLTLRVASLGRRDYGEVLALQERLRDAVGAGAEECLLSSSIRRSSRSDAARTSGTCWSSRRRSCA